GAPGPSTGRRRPPGLEEPRQGQRHPASLGGRRIGRTPRRSIRVDRLGHGRHDHRQHNPHTGCCRPHEATSKPSDSLGAASHYSWALRAPGPAAIGANRRKMPAVSAGASRRVVDRVASCLSPTIAPPRQESDMVCTLVHRHAWTASLKSPRLPIGGFATGRMCQIREPGRVRTRACAMGPAEIVASLRELCAEKGPRLSTEQIVAWIERIGGYESEAELITYAKKMKARQY